MPYISLARWLAYNLREWAVDNFDDDVLGIAMIYEPDFVLGTILTAEVGDGKRVWDVIYEKCLKDKIEVITGCGGDPETCDDLGEFDDAMKCVADALKPAFKELPQVPWSQFKGKMGEAVERLKEEDGGEDDVEEEDMD